MAALLKLESITKRFGGILALNQVDLEIDYGQFVGIVGPNGSGKTTLFNIINGVYIPDEGRVIFEDRDITRLSSHRRASLGLARTFQIPRPFSSATVRENVAVGAMFGSMGKQVNVNQSLDIADDVIQRVGLSQHRNKVASILTPVEKKLMEIARALAMKPKLLLMDEAMAGMHPSEIDRLVEFLRTVASEENVAIVAMVEHVMRAVVGMAQKVVVLHQGAKICDAATEDALNDPQVIECYLGRPPEEESA
jgi:branched-chain amino acid transport system ATP-binding protein